MNVKKPNSFINNNNNNSNINQKLKFNKTHQILSQKVSKKKNIYQSDKKRKTNNSPYYTLRQKKASTTSNINYTNNIMSAEKQKILLQKRELEIKDLKMKCEKLEQENHKYQIQNILLKNSQNNNNNNNNNNCFSNNTSSNFPIKNEVKNIWEKFAKVDLLNNFIEFENEPEIIYHLICELISLSDKMIKEHSTSKYKEIIKIMGVKNNSIIIKDIETQFKNFMKEHLNEIFNYFQDKTFINDYKKQLKNIVKNSINCINDKNMLIFEDILEQNEFNDMLKNINDIILFTQFNEPSLYFKIENKYENRKIKYMKINNENKNEYIIINNQGKLNGFINTVVLLEPPTVKSGFIYCNELKPILIITNKEIKDDINSQDIINNMDNISININLNRKEFLSIQQNDSKNDKDIINEQIKFNSINNTSRIHRNINIISNKKCKENKYKNYYTSDNYNISNKKLIKKTYKNRKSSNTYYHKFTIDKTSCYEDNKKIKNIISINSSRPTEKTAKTIKKLSISKDLYLDEHDFYSTDENGFIENKRYKRTIVSNKNLYNKRDNQIHRIKSANNYFDKKKKNNKEKNIFLKHKTDMIVKEGTIKMNNNYKEYINNNNNNENISNNSNNNIFMKSSDGNQSLSKEKSSQKPLFFTKNKNIKNKNQKNNNNYFSNNNKSNNPINARKGINNQNSQTSSINNRTLKNSKSKINLNTNNYQSKILMSNKIIIKNIISPSKPIKTNKTKNYKDNKLFRKEKNENNNDTNINLKDAKNIIYRMQNIKNNFSNNNLLNNNRNLNLYYSDLSTKRTKPNEKRLDSNEQKNSFAYSSLEEIKKLMDEGNHIHKPVRIISTNSNNNTINAKKQMKRVKQNFNKKYKKIGKNNNNYNNKKNSIKQLISLSQPRIIDNGNINFNFNNIFIDNRYKKMNTKSLETINICINGERHKYIDNNKGLYCKQFSVDETTFNTSSQFNLTHEYNNKISINNNNNNKYYKMLKNKHSKTLHNEVKNKCKSTTYNNNLNINNNTNKNRIKEIKINIDGFNNNYNTINPHSNKNKFRNFFHSFENCNYS